MDGMTVKLIPSAEGSNAFMQRGRRLERVPLAGGTDAPGLILEGSDPARLEKLVDRGYVSLLEADSADFLQHRELVGRLTRCMGTAAVRAAFAGEVGRTVTTLQKQSRRGNHDTATSSERPGATVKLLLASLRDQRRDVVEGAATLIRGMDRTLLAGMTGIIRSEPTGEALRQFRRIIARYAERWQTPEYLSLVVLELASNLQVQTMQQFARRTGVSTEKIRNLYQNPAVRDEIRRRMERQGETRAITWAIAGHRGFGSRNSELTVTMAGSGMPMRQFTSEVQGMQRVEVGERSLQQFYTGLNDSDFNLDLGLYYISYLEELCHKAGIRFTTRANEALQTGEISVSLRLTL